MKKIETQIAEADRATLVAALTEVLALCQKREDDTTINVRNQGYRAPRQYANESTLVISAQIRAAISRGLTG